MDKKAQDNDSKTKPQAPAQPAQFDINQIPNLPKEAKEKLEKIRKKLEDFQKEVLAKFDKYVIGISLLPAKNMIPPVKGIGFPQPMTLKQPPVQQAPKQDEISVLVLVDDSDSKRMRKFELLNKLNAIIQKIAKDIDPKIKPETVILSEVWQNCYDAKYELLKLISMSVPVYDTGMLSAIKISEIHKQMVLKKFERYICCYVLAGSLVQGKATPESDIDVFIVIDDTDVKKMTRAELKDKLRAIIIGMGLEAGELTKIRNKINIQVYILTDFWDNIKEANPIIFTFLRDGIPFYDRGIFMPWKQLLKMGRVKPSQESIDIFMHSGDQMLQRIKFKIRGIGMDDIFYSILTPSQAALMLYGYPPPTPKETPGMMREVFIKKEKLLEEEYIKILEDSINTRKELEHGTMKDITGKDIDKLMENSEKYLKRIKKLFKQIDKIKEEESVLHLYENCITICRDVLKLEGEENVKETELEKIFQAELIHKGKIPQKYDRMLSQIIKAKKDYDEGKLTKTDIHNVRKDSKDFIKFMIEYIQRKRGKELEKTKIRVKHGSKFGEVTLLGKEAFIIHDIDNEEKDISKAEIDEKGKLINIKKSSLEEYEKALTKLEIPAKVFIKQPIFEDLKNIFGKDVEILINY
ncbi:nucleotidyltransferase domain-containing protein [Candidatus Woesearchaeota archaeon]|nr:nucleotidyltransferase domain-containing protein [Candidatus Woesearchaeota archaeon]